MRWPLSCSSELPDEERRKITSSDAPGPQRDPEPGPTWKPGHQHQAQRGGAVGKKGGESQQLGLPEGLTCR